MDDNRIFISLQLNYSLFSFCHIFFFDYLQSLVNTTVITVSHDTQFMEQICTDVIHYEKRERWIHCKLIHYRGTMSDFVKKQPQTKHY
jgi:elongation factor 3